MRRGIIVEDVDPDGPAAEAGLQPGDIIYSVGGNAVIDASRLAAEIAQRPIGNEISVDVMRGTEKLNLTMEIDESPDDALKFADMVSRESNLVRQFGILALNLSDQFGELLQTLRIPGHVLVAAKVAGLPGPSQEFQAGDVIGAVNGQAISDINALRGILSKMQSGDPVVVNIQRGSQLAMLAFELP